MGRYENVAWILLAMFILTTIILCISYKYLFLEDYLAFKTISVPCKSGEVNFTRI